MGKIVLGMVIVAAMVLLASSAQADVGVSIWDIDVCEHTDGLYGEVGLRNRDTDNITVLLFVDVDGVSVYGDRVQTNVRQFKGFTVSRIVYTEFKINDEVGTHQMDVSITDGRNVQYEIYEYTVYEPEEEEIDEEEINVEDWLGCP